MWWRQAAYGAAAAAAAMLAMAAVAAAAVSLTGADRYGETGALTAATVVLATGGAIDVSSLGISAAPLPVAGYGELALRPLGVSLAGALAFGAALLLPLRRSPGPPATPAARAASVAPVPALAVRAGSAALGMVALAGLASGLARGSLTVPVEGESGTEQLVIGFGPGLPGTLTGALAWALVVLGGCWLGWSRAPVPAGWRRWRDPVRPVLVAAGAVAAAGVAVIVVGAGVAAVWADDGPALLGTALLAAPTVLVVLVTIGLGAGWTVGLHGPLGERLDTRLAELGEEPTLSLGRLAGEYGGTGWLVPAGVAVVFLLACGAAAARAPVPGAPLRAAAVRAGWLGAVLAVAVPVLATLAAITLGAGLSVLGNQVPLLEAELRTSLPLAAGLGLAGGGAAGFLGSLAIDGIRRVRPGTRPAAGRRSYARGR